MRAALIITLALAAAVWFINPWAGFWVAVILALLFGSGGNNELRDV